MNPLPKGILCECGCRWWVWDWVTWTLSFAQQALGKPQPDFRLLAWKHAPCRKDKDRAMQRGHTWRAVESRGIHWRGYTKNSDYADTYKSVNTYEWKGKITFECLSEADPFKKKKGGYTWAIWWYYKTIGLLFRLKLSLPVANTKFMIVFGLCLRNSNSSS